MWGGPTWIGACCFFGGHAFPSLGKMDMSIDRAACNSTFPNFHTGTLWRLVIDVLIPIRSSTRFPPPVLQAPLPGSCRMANDRPWASHGRREWAMSATRATRRAFGKQVQQEKRHNDLGVGSLKETRDSKTEKGTKRTSPSTCYYFVRFVSFFVAI